jgi:signal transduction histidine kinase
MSSDPAEISASQGFYQAYETERRLRITRLVAPLFGVATVVFIALLVSALSLPKRAGSAGQALPPVLIGAGLGLLGLGALLHALGAVAAFRDRVGIATNAVVAALLINTLFGGSLWTFTLGLGPFILACYMLTALVIVLIGVLAEPVVTISATILMNAYVVFLTYLAPREPGMSAPLGREGALICAGAIALQWCFTGVMISTGQAQRQTLRELGSVRLAFERARQLDEIKDQFIRNVNHELRNPIMAMHGYVRLLQEGGETLSGTIQREFVDRASKAGTRLIALLNRILDTGKMAQQLEDVTVEAVLLRDLVIEAAQSIDPTDGLLSEQHLQIDIAPNLTILADRVRLLQVLTNLLSNAVKYSPEGTDVSVTAVTVQKNDPNARRRVRTRKLLQPPMAVISVRDRGLGIPPDQIPLLFQRFMRLPRDITSPVSGSGLGLYICKTLVQAMQGTIWVESTGIPGEGTTFNIQLPVASPAPVPQLVASA